MLDGFIETEIGIGCHTVYNDCLEPWIFIEHVTNVERIVLG
jgi:hypothetical protein